MQLDPNLIDLLRCPVSGELLRQSGDLLVNVSGNRTYRITDSGIPLFAENFSSAEGKIQQSHYDKVASSYIENLGYPHTQAYMQYLDGAFLRHMERADLSSVAEICCGRGEAFHLIGQRIGQGIGVDVSLSMLEVARRELSAKSIAFVQGDATLLPLRNEIVDSVIMLGGIHHVNDRQRLFAEVFRVLRPGGKFYWREPLNDFVLWRLLRAVIYRISSALDYDTERPLRYRETIPPLNQAGFKVQAWETYGFLGFCLFMNSDVLIFNRLFRFIPGIRTLTRWAAAFDDWTLRLPGFKNLGLQVIGVAEKPLRLTG